MSLQLSGRVALVTGASRGIGAAIAKILAEQGVNLAITATNKKNLEQTEKTCRAHGVSVFTLAMDMGSTESIHAGVNAVLQQYDAIHILINNAGVMGQSPAQEMPIDMIDQLIDVNVKGLMKLTSAALPHLLKNESGAVINIASIAGRVTYATGSAYTASKHAVMGYTGSLYDDVRAAGIKVSAICPGFVDTDMVRSDKLDGEKMIQPRDVAEAVSYVLTSPATVCPTEIVLRPQFSPFK